MRVEDLEVNTKNQIIETEKGKNMKRGHKSMNYQFF